MVVSTNSNVPDLRHTLAEMLLAEHLNPDPGGRPNELVDMAHDMGAEAPFLLPDAKREPYEDRNKLMGYDLAMLPQLDRCSYDRLACHVVERVTPEEQAGRIDLATYLPGDLLPKVDIAAMAHGLETRAPFLNHELVEWVSRIPGERKSWKNEGKALLKAALEPYVPNECMYRPKVGFRVPVAKLLREDAYEAARATLLGERFLDRRLIRRSFVKEMLQEHHTRQQEHGTRLWALIMLELWFRTWIDNEDNRPLSTNDNPFAEFALREKLGTSLIGERSESGVPIQVD